MTAWTVQTLDADTHGLFDPASVLVVTANEAGLGRLQELRDRVAAKSKTPQEQHDMSVTIVFRPGDPAGLTEVSVGCDELSESQYLAVIEETMFRLQTFLEDYEEAKQSDRQPALLM